MNLQGPALVEGPSGKGIKGAKNTRKKIDGNKLAVASIDESFRSGRPKTLHVYMLPRHMFVASPSATNIQRLFSGFIPKSVDVALSDA
ncbi:MAG: hypothetical protein WBZ42_08520 [Halobacteriota archaeon]